MTLHQGPWKLSDLKDIPKNGKKVFSCFHCGGGSTMGYKLAGYDVLGGVEIDPDMMKIYRKNHNPKYSFEMGVSQFNDLPDSEIPPELFEIDILDGSPPCSSFSMSGNREKDWGKEKHFREGQKTQVLDDLFFEFIKTAKKLRPKVVVSENVKGLLTGAAKGYVRMILDGFTEIGYETQMFLLNASDMGVPQRRERVFFVSKRIDLKLPKLVLSFKEKQINAKTAISGIDIKHKMLTPDQNFWWEKTMQGKAFSSAHPKGFWFNCHRLSENEVVPTITSACGNGGFYHWNEPRQLTGAEYVRLQTFPDDYDFLEQKEKYVCGMSVPPFMMERLSAEIYSQILSS